MEKSFYMEFPSAFLVFRKIIRPTATQSAKKERGSQVKITFSCLRVIHIFINNQKSVASFFTALLNVFHRSRDSAFFSEMELKTRNSSLFSRPWKLNIYE